MTTAPPHSRRLALLAAAPLLLTACMSLAPDYERPALPVPARLDAGAPEQPANAAPLPAPGPQAFVQPPRLRALLGQALADNRDLRQSLLAVERARALYGVSRADLWPTVSAGAGASRARTADDLTAAGRASTTSQYSASIGLASYEIDFWGRVRNLNEAALQEFLRSQDNLQSARIALVAELTQAWVALDADARRLQLARATLQARQQQLQLTAQSHRLGAASALTLAQVQTTVDSARVDLAATQAQVARDRNALDLLAGGPVPAQWLPPSATADVPAPAAPSLDQATRTMTEQAHRALLTAPVTALPAVAPNLPSSVLLARPDVQAAERTLVASHAQIGVARAAFFPSITLTASAGTASDELSRLFAGGNGTWSFAPQIRLPLLDGGRNRANLRAAELARDSAQAQYEKAIQSAFREVRDALADRVTLDERLQAQQSLVAASEQALELSQARWRLGADSYLAVLDAQRSLYSAQQGLIGLQQAEQNNRVALYRALGGQWRGADTAQPRADNGTSGAD